MKYEPYRSEGKEAEPVEDRNRHMDKAAYRAMSTPALTELLRRDVRENLLDVDTVYVIAGILKDRREREDPDSIPPVDLAWKSFRENYLSIRAHIRRFFRRILPKLGIALGILTAIAVIFWLQSLPVITESLTETVRLENGRFTVDGLRAGMSREEVIAWMEERKLAYTENSPYDFYAGYRTSSGLLAQLEDRGGTWISLQGVTRIEELEKIPVRRTYHFRDGKLTSVEFVTEPIRGDIQSSIRLYRLLVLTAEISFGMPLDWQGKPWTASDFSRPGTDRALWYGADGSSLELCGRYFQQFRGSGSAKVYYTPNGSAALTRDGRLYRDAARFVDYFEMTVTITL